MDLEPRPGTPHLWRFTLVVLAALAVILIVRLLVTQIFGHVISGGATAVLPPIAGAIHVGQVWGRAATGVPSGPAMWRFAVMGGLIHLGVRLPFTLLSLTGLERPGNLIGLVLALEALVLVVSVLVIRFLLVHAARAGAKAAR